MRWGVKTFRPFLIDVEFIIHTDQQPHVYLNNMRLIDSRLDRTLEDLADYNFAIQYTPGKENAAADCLSRLYDPEHVHPSTSAVLQDGYLQEGVYLHGIVPGGGNSLFESLHVVADRSESVTRVRVPQKLREELLDEMLNHPERYDIKLDRFSRKKLRLMKFSGQLLSVEVIFAFGRVYNCVVLVNFGGGVTNCLSTPSG